MQLLLSPEAQSDIADILLYTAQRWGEEQQDRYATALDRGLSLLQVTWWCASMVAEGAFRP